MIFTDLIVFERGLFLKGPKRGLFLKMTTADAWVAPHGKRVFGLADYGPPCILGPGELFRVVMQRPQGLSPFIRKISGIFSVRDYVPSVSY